MNKNIVLCGVGGQGTVLASRLIAAAAMEKGLKVMSAETIGMAQRGGNVFSNLRIGENLKAPLLSSGQADLILGFEPGETVRMLHYLKKDGIVVTNTRAVKPTTANLAPVSPHRPHNGDILARWPMRAQMKRLFMAARGTWLRPGGGGRRAQ